VARKTNINGKLQILEIHILEGLLYNALHYTGWPEVMCILGTWNMCYELTEITLTWVFTYIN
jgi:hypothetical protein